MKFELKKPDAGTLLGIGAGLAAIFGAVCNSKKDKLDKDKALDKTVDKVYEKVMEKISSNQD